MTKDLKISFDQYKLIVFTLLIAFLAGSCNTTKYLADGESLVKGYKIKVNTKENDVASKTIAADLDRFVQQKPNSKALLFIPREYNYFQSAKDEKKLAKYDGELPSILDTLATDKSAELMSQFLNFQNGYYGSYVKAETKIKNKKAYVTYNVDLGRRYYVDSVTYVTSDTALQRILNELQKNSLVQKGEALKESNFLQEKNRITNELQNRGYSDFAPNYINIVGDSTNGDYTTDVFFEIIPPLPKPNHQVYKVGKITVYTDYYNKQDTADIDRKLLEGIEYLKESSKYVVSPNVLNNYISLRPGAYVSREDRTKTYRKLSNLSTYRFSAIIPRPNPLDSAVIDYDIQLTPFNTLWTADYGIDFFNSTITNNTTDTSNLGGTLIGLGISANMVNRNLFGGSERLTMVAEASTQLQLGGGNLVRSINLSLNNNLLIPVFKDPLKLVRSLNKLTIINDKLYEGIKRDGTSSVSLGIADADVKELYRIFGLNGSFGYRFTDDVNRTLNINPIGFNLNSYTIQPKFEERIDSNYFIKKSFEDNLMTGLVFRNLEYVFNGKKNEKGFSKGLIVNIEQSGAEILLLNSIANGISGNNNSWGINIGGQKFEFSKFMKMGLDGRINKAFGPKTSFVTRMYLGIVRPFSNTQSTPYLKKEFVGGPNSLRAWESRSLGPGNLIPDAGSLVPYSQGDFKLELNAEYRFDIWQPTNGITLEGALFTDIGNVWNINEVGGNLSSKFYKDLAVASGWGLRWDFSYFLIRFDFAYKIRKPFLTENEDFYWYSWDKIKSQKLGTIQVGVNYPF